MRTTMQIFKKGLWNLSTPVHNHHHEQVKGNWVYRNECLFLNNSYEWGKPLKNLVAFLCTKKNGFEISSVSEDTFLVMPHPRSSAFNGPHVLKSAFEVLHVIPLFCMSSLIYMTFPHKTYKRFGNSNTTLCVTIGQNYLCAALNMPASLENSAVATGLEKVSFHSSPKERQCQRRLKLPHNCTHLTRQ